MGERGATCGPMLSVDDFLQLRRSRLWPGLATWRPFLCAMLPCYSMGAMLVLQPVFFNTLMQEEWLSHLEQSEGEWRMSCASMLMFSCWMVGSPFWTRLADRYGRKPAFLACSFLTLALAAASVLAQSFTVFLCLRAALGLTISGQAAIAFVLTVEWALQRDASLLTFLGNVLFSLSHLLLVLIAYLGNQYDLGWREMQLAICALIAPPLIAAPWVLLESPRFLLGVDQAAQAEMMLRLATRYDGAQPPLGARLWMASPTASTAPSDVQTADASSVLSAGGGFRAATASPTSDITRLALVHVDSPPLAVLESCGPGSPAAEGAQNTDRVLPREAPREPTSFMDHLKDRRTLLHLGVVCFSWLGVNLLFYGLDFANGGNHESGNMYGNGALTAVADLPGCAAALFLADDPLLGRRYTMSGSFLVGGASLLGMALVHAFCDEGVLLPFLAFIGKCATASAFQLAYIYPSERFPVSMRSSALGVANVFGRLAAVAAPQAANVPPVLLQLGFGSLSLTAGLATLILPETLQRPGAADKQALRGSDSAAYGVSAPELAAPEARLLDPPVLNRLVVPPAPEAADPRSVSA